MPEPMTLTVHIRGDRAAVVTVTGDVDVAGARRLEPLVELGDTGLELVVDLSGVTHLDASACRALGRARDACVQRGHSLMVRAPSRASRDVLEATVEPALTMVNNPAVRA